jgi:NhaP-type Na+/H+ or K+/H+ antiporter
VSKQTTDQVTVRRAPRIPAFIAVGAVLGALVTLVLTSLFPADPSVGFGALFAYFALYGVTGGVVLGAIVGIILDRVSTRRAKTVTVQTETVSPDRVDEA